MSTLKYCQHLQYKQLYKQFIAANSILGTMIFAFRDVYTSAWLPGVMYLSEKKKKVLLAAKAAVIAFSAH